MMCGRLFTFLGVGMLSVSPAWAQFESGSDGSDGPFKPTEDVEVDLSQALTGSWDMLIPPENAGQGVYDAEKWAVVFKYTTIDIPRNITVTFGNHPSGAPVVWLASEDVTIDGTVDLNGEDGQPFSDDLPFAFAQPSPGGFAGGQRGANSKNMPSSGGFGPGGGGPGSSGGGNAGYAQNGSTCGGGGGGDSYGNTSLLPSIGGSGGGAGYYLPSLPGGGGAGAGAILIASSGDITLAADGLIRADGGDAGESCAGAGSGGAIRLIANSIIGEGRLRARGGTSPCCVDASPGRIRVEADPISLTDQGIPDWTWSTPGWVFPPANAPTLRVVSLVSQDGTQDIPADPAAGILTTDVEINDPAPVIIYIEAHNIPLEPPVNVQVRVVSARGGVITEWSQSLDGTFQTSTTTAKVTFPPGRSEIHLKANWQLHPVTRSHRVFE